jgi:hypothetical protein
METVELRWDADMNVLSKAGISLFATVMGDAVTLPLVQNVIDAAKAGSSASWVWSHSGESLIGLLISNAHSTRRQS